VVRQGRDPGFEVKVWKRGFDCFGEVGVGWSESGPRWIIWDPPLRAGIRILRVSRSSICCSRTRAPGTTTRRRIRRLCISPMMTSCRAWISSRLWTLSVKGRRMTTCAGGSRNLQILYVSCPLVSCVQFDVCLFCLKALSLLARLRAC
jgi:hypothetical protein